MKKQVLFFAIMVTIASCKNETKAPEPTAPTPVAEAFVPTIDYTVAGTLPHDTNSFTEGLFFNNGQLYESTGSPDDLPQLKSVFGTVDVKTGKVDKKIELDKATYFGEGTVILNNKLYQLTYKNQICFLYDAKTYKPMGQFRFKNEEGWGLTTDGTNIIMSDGTDNLSILDPTNFNVIKTLNVTNGGYPENNLNELEYIKGFIYANVWMKNYVVKIDPASGKVVGLIDLAPLKYKADDAYKNSEVTNGIAYDATADKIYVTGKLWPNLYELKFPH
ncbi:MAG: hypothetical protein JWP12_2705 [Bacteroidetes bacterium]|nr:hypothetical protein [Bacteroidota bacterium]